MFKVAGLSRHEGVLKLRFANDMVSRVKVLQRNGHKDIDLVELPQAMTKDAAVAYLSTLDTFADTESQAVFADYAAKNAPKEPKQPKAKVAPKQELDVQVDLETDAQKSKREKDAARKRDARAKAKAAKSGETVAEA